MSCSYCGESGVDLRHGECDACRTCARCQQVSDELLDAEGRCVTCRPREPMDDDEGECAYCGGSGGGPDAALACRMCSGRGY